MKTIMFPELGSDIGIRIGFKQCEALQNEIGEDWASKASERIQALDIEFLKRILATSGKKGNEPFEIDAEAAIEKIGIVEVANRALDSLCWIIRNKSLADYQAEILADMEKMNA